MSQRKVSRMVWNGEEVVERALTGGVFLCHFLDKVSAISLMVNTVFLSHLSLVIYYLPLFLSPFHCLCVSVHPVLLLLYIWPMCRVHYTLPRFITAQRWAVITTDGCALVVPPLCPTSVTGHPLQHSRSSGVRWHVHVFVCLIWYLELFLCSHKTPQSCYLQETKVTCL